MVVATSSCCGDQRQSSLYIKVYFDFPLRRLKNLNVTRADSARDDNCRFPEEKEMLTC
jgi:hypothetical protein